MASMEVISTVYYEHDALELLELGSDIGELYDLVPEWCVERNVVARRIEQRMRRLLTIKTGAGRGEAV